jgi:hypothetical protein
MNDDFDRIEAQGRTGHDQVLTVVLVLILALAERFLNSNRNLTALLPSETLQYQGPHYHFSST